jgi:hypothetical protein
MSNIELPLVEPVVTAIIRDVCELPGDADGPDALNLTVSDLRVILERNLSEECGVFLTDQALLTQCVEALEETADELKTCSEQLRAAGMTTTAQYAEAQEAKARELIAKVRAK